MQTKEKLALFDFCETLANFQTADAFIKYVREHTNSSSMNLKENIRILLVRIKLITILERLFRHSSINKRLVLWQLKGFSSKELELHAESYYKNVIKTNLINEVVEELLRLKKSNWSILIVSAGYDIYLKYFCLDFGIPLDNLIAVKIKFEEGICMGVFDGGDRLWDKTEKLDQRYQKSNVKSIAYSDSISDVPLLQWANEGVVVRRVDKNRWDSEFKYREILWHK